MIWDAVSRRIPHDGDAVDGGRLLVLGQERRRRPQQEGHGGDDGEKTLHPHWVGGGRAGSGGGRRAAALGLGAGQRPEGQPLAVGRDVDLDLVAAAELAHEDLLAERILDVPLDRPLERPRAVALVVAVLDQEVDGGRGVSLTSSPRRRCTSLSRIVTICAMCSLASGWNTMTSSSRFRNSGLNTFFISSLHLLLHLLEAAPWRRRRGSRASCPA